jgi:spore maturation protein CgeB
VTFYEPDAWDRQAHRDIDDPDWCRVVVYPARGEDGVRRALRDAEEADLVVKASGVGIFDDLLEEEVLRLKQPNRRVVYWDVDAPATLASLREDPRKPLRSLIPMYDLVFTYGGGPPVVLGYEGLGARRCVPIYNAVDPDTHHPVPPDPRFEGDLAFLGHRLPDREARVEQFFFEAARTLPNQRFLLGGCGWDDKPRPDNVSWIGHVGTNDHNAFNCSSRAVLNINRASMASNGWSPATRVFEAAGAGACLITDAWEGIEQFLTPGREVLVAHGADDVIAHLRALTPQRRLAIGAAARHRVLSEHTYAHRAARVEAALDASREKAA